MSCPDCFSGHKHTGDPKGREGIIHGRNTYISEPPEGKSAKGIIIIIPDAFGWQFVNNRILADHYAAKGDYLVYLPDFHDNSAAPEWLIEYMPKVMDVSTIMSWVQKPIQIGTVIYGAGPFAFHNRFSVSMPKVTAFFSSVRLNEGASLPIGAAGFCWGGPHTITLASGAKASNGKPLVDAGFTGHPSNVSFPKDLEKLVKPLSIASGDKDPMLGEKTAKTVQEAFAKLEKVNTEIKVYEGAGHGFCVRADGARETIKQAHDAEDQAIAWFQKHFKS